ncbi:hypothetical protein DQ04_03111080 [Trypanosoma grayi]|uniref:hypothetical protein n=1 Tax=Trypanosoma grayi TaxID=71804 RepID=UPI0004F484AA|nr:hypothetical protein DQ04_03111080 [Trypanosoma grayi]KEG10963.1 hypothetical protein DQ04_03111080 [Trypanosoma grayi]
MQRPLGVTPTVPPAAPLPQNSPRKCAGRRCRVSLTITPVSSCAEYRSSGCDGVDVTSRIAHVWPLRLRTKAAVCVS